MASHAANLWVLLGLGLAGILLMTKRLKKTIKADFGAFIQKLELLPPPQPAPPKAPHPLAGLTFAVSDIFDIEGYVTGFGHPDWEKTHEASSHTSSVVLSLVEGGATCVGKTIVDELAYSIHGENKHYSTPTNPSAPACIPGGSSSGAAVAVAANFVDFSLGLFAKDPNILRRVGPVLLQLPFLVQRNPRKILLADDCFQLLKIPMDRVSQVVINSTEKHFGRQLLKHENLENYFSSKVPSLKEFYSEKINCGSKISSISLLANVAQFLQRYEFKCVHEEWIKSEKPGLDSAVSAQINETLDMTDREIEICKSIRNEMGLAVDSLLKDDGILVIPTTAYLPPKLGSKEVFSEDYQNCMFSLLSIASMSGCCQVTLPLGYHDKCPVSVSFIARRGGDRFLLDTVQTMYSSLQEYADTISKSKLLRKAVNQEHSADVAKEKGNQAYKDKQWQKAIGFYTEAIKLSGNNATYYGNRAAAYLELGSFLQAEADCTKAINLDKKNVKAYLRRGTAREMLGYYKEAIEDFRYALVLEPTNKRAALSAERLRKLFQ
ncbi:outer envelope protein 64, chloroplastic-like isoform X3 [Durio zibethinus]|uniref:Outer envelope protein 64, chloroplastic-like isoform X3 n=1 Tax=Durio zibethinus TaxID=66656 RepID=A0A6P5YDM1_DURZI|nr:outer envelope protein 64, chloroplastic-like isoform X3 [Durio zibethinus]